MLENLKIPEALADELIELKPKIDRMEELKTSIRGFGANAYSRPTGQVVVSEPGVSRRTGTKLIIDEAKLSEVDPPVLASMLEKGFLRWEDTYSRATAAQVRISCNA